MLNKYSLFLMLSLIVSAVHPQDAEKEASDQTQLVTHPLLTLPAFLTSGVLKGTVAPLHSYLNALNASDNQLAHLLEALVKTPFVSRFAEQTPENQGIFSLGMFIGSIITNMIATNMVHRMLGLQPTGRSLAALSVLLGYIAQRYPVQRIQQTPELTD